MCRLAGMSVEEFDSFLINLNGYREVGNEGFKNDFNDHEFGCIKRLRRRRQLNHNQHDDE
jgi:hypothetical protein